MTSSINSDSVEKWRRLSELFDEIETLDLNQRTKRLAEIANSENTLACELERMLSANDRADDFLEQGAYPVFSPNDNSLQLFKGQILGHWRIIEPIGAGGMAIVYLAERADGLFKKRVALKYVKSKRADLGNRLLMEINILSRFEHPNIPRMLDGGIHDGMPYIVMEYIDGLLLDRWVERNQPDCAKRMAIFRQIASALHYAHLSGVIHRDLKSRNILVEDGGHTWLLDFGIGGLIDAAPNLGEPDWTMTPDFAAPEQVRGEASTIQTDVYGLGALLYWTLAGSPPFRTGDMTLSDLLFAILNKKVVKPSLRTNLARGGLPASEIKGDLDAIVLRAMERRSEDRYQSIADMLLDIDRWQNALPVAARSSNPAYALWRLCARYRWQIYSAAATITALLSILAK